MDNETIVIFCNYVADIFCVGTTIGIEKQSKCSESI